MTNSELRAFDAAVAHALHYKALFHAMQEKLWASQDEVVRRGRMIDRQRAVIAKLESDLGIDQDL